VLSAFDRRVLSERALDFVRVAEGRAPCRLGGGAALSGAWLAHRTSRDLDLFFSDREDLRAFVVDLSSVAREARAHVELVRDSGTHVRAALELAGQALELDLVHDPLPDIGPEAPSLEGIRLVPLPDLRASKLTCLLSRAEPRDLVDVLFLDRGGFPPERDLELALRKDAGVDPSVLAWLVRQIPLEPMPVMLVPLTSAELAGYREELAKRFKQVALGPGEHR
jgi:hypothetical protein